MPWCWTPGFLFLLTILLVLGSLIPSDIVGLWTSITSDVPGHLWVTSFLQMVMRSLKRAPMVTKAIPSQNFLTVIWGVARDTNSHKNPHPHIKGRRCKEYQLKSTRRRLAPASNWRPIIFFLLCFLARRPGAPLIAKLPTGLECWVFCGCA